MKYADESKAEFVRRIKKESGLGTLELAAVARKPPIVERSREAIIKDQCAHEERYFGKEYQLGSAAKWGWVA
jgi:hypothetical protein